MLPVTVSVTIPISKYHILLISSIITVTLLIVRFAGEKDEVITLRIPCKNQLIFYGIFLIISFDMEIISNRRGSE